MSDSLSFMWHGAQQILNSVLIRGCVATAQRLVVLRTSSLLLNIIIPPTDNDDGKLRASFLASFLVSQ